MFSVLNLLLFVAVVSSYPHYQLMIPNGEWVPSPCGRGEVWMGVGHLNPDGGGARNPFGVDFAKNDHQWARVCRLDSDDDGRTNGEELGDPDCTWQPGTTPSLSNDLSHPGVCEPLNSTRCQRRNRWLKKWCRKPPSCEKRINRTDVLKKTLRFPSTSVPAANNTHMCYGINLPDDITVNRQLPLAFEPLLDNIHVMHHMNLWGCADVPDELYETPKPCKRTRACLHRRRLWTNGQHIRCTPTSQLELGLLVNSTHLAFKYAILELHWRNALRSSDHVDSSGIVMFYGDSGGVFSGSTALKATTTLLIITLQFLFLHSV